MQRIVLVCCLMFFGYHLSSQEIGVRFGDMYGNNIAVDATFPVKNKRIHARHGNFEKSRYRQARCQESESD